MRISNPLLPSVPEGMQVDELALDADALTITARTTAARAACPHCGRWSARVHSSYWRTLMDLPWQDRSVTWRVKVRRFRCSHCPGRIFAEPIPCLARARAQRSDRLAEAQTDIGMALGGEAGARLSRRLAMLVSGDTVLRVIRRCKSAGCAPPRVVGIDDWAWRRGRRYGTIVCDLERGRVLDLLPGRACEPVRDWLAAHPDIAVVSRDRAGPYAEAARLGAPQAIQIADRWHLLVNASEALRSLVERHQAEIREAARQAAFQDAPAAIVAVAPADPPAEQDTGHGGGRRRQRCEAALRLHGEGVAIKTIARTLGASRNSIRRWLRVGASRHRLRGRLRDRPALGEATAPGPSNPTALGSHSIDTPHRAVPDKRSGQPPAGGSPLHRSAVWSCAQAAGRGRAGTRLRGNPSRPRSGRFEALAGGGGRE
jgi:Transposase/zinc-finger of transposase IS204/IS1001/IS1096/IS1165